MSTAETARLYVRDLGREVQALALGARSSLPDQSAEFDAGRRMAFYEVISLMQQQADAFGMSYEEIGLSGIDPERDVL